MISAVPVLISVRRSLELDRLKAPVYRQVSLGARARGLYVTRRLSGSSRRSHARERGWNNPLLRAHIKSNFA